MNKFGPIQPLEYKLSSGFSKQWIFKKNNSFSMINDVYQKISYTVSDLNGEIQHLLHAQPKDILYVIFLVDWIASAVPMLRSEVPKEMLTDFSFEKEHELSMAREYLKALRSFAGAHPLNTDKHKKCGFDGTKLCIDIRPTISVLDLLDGSRCYRLTYDGLLQNPEERTGDYYLFTYSKDDNYQFFYIIACDYSDLYRTAQLYLDKLYALDVYLSKQKQTEWKGKL